MEGNDCEEVNCDENQQHKSITEDDDDDDDDDDDGDDDDDDDDDDKDEDEISVYMTTPSDGASYLCSHCVFKMTIDVIYDNQIQSHTDYAASDCRD